MANNLRYKSSLNLHVLSFNLSVVVLVWLMTTTTASSVGHQAPRGGGSSYKCIDKERQTLLDFKAHLQEDPNGEHYTWKPEENEDCCKWRGVVCDKQTGHVTKLNLSHSFLRGEISPSLLNLTHLNLLDLSSNRFTGTIPTSIGSLTELRYLYLQFNDFTGTIPMSIGSLTELRHLYLQVNDFTGTIPMSIGSLTELRHLDLSENILLNGTIPTELGNLTNLEYLSLAYLESCTVETLDWLSHLSQLEVLSMDGVSLAKANHWVNVISGLHKLSILSLYGCDLCHVMYPYSSSLNSSSSTSIVLLDLSNNNLNSSMYQWLLPLTSTKLEFLYLSGNMLDGIPKYLGNLCSLEYLELSDNSAVVEFPDFLSNLSGCTSASLRYLIASNNSFQGVRPDAYMSNLSNIEYIDLSSCKQLGPHFPEWIQTLKNLTHLDISNTGISGTIPVEFWNMWPSRLTYLSLSSNNLTGMVPDLLSNFDPNYSVIDLSSNNFYGLIPHVPSTLEKLDLSKNKFSGELSFLCQITDGLLSYLDLSNNSLIEQIPNCLSNFKYLTVLNLGYNNFFGSLPPSVEFLISLEVLYINNNNISGELPLSLKNCTSLSFMHLGNNRFSGNVPFWIGENLSKLYALNLASNNFSGTINEQLCQLVNLQILDLSMNNINGTIPSCVTNLTAMVQEGSSPNHNMHVYRIPQYLGNSQDWYLDHAMMMWQGSVREFTSNLGLMKIINLSNNNLTGQIPYEVTNLHQLLVLNLSHNALHGMIPQQIGEMKKLLALDLSRNNLSGGIPSSLSQVTLLNDLDVSYNNLSGRIPSGTQLQSFEPSRYIGNAGLCGLPLEKKCPGDEDLEVPRVIGESGNDDVEDADELQKWFYIGGATGFAIGFWTAPFLTFKIAMKIGFI